MRCTWGNFSRTIRGLPSVEALSTIQASNGEVGGFARIETRQSSNNLRVFQLTTTIESDLGDNYLSKAPYIWIHYFVTVISRIERQLTKEKVRVTVTWVFINNKSPLYNLGH